MSYTVNLDGDFEIFGTATEADLFAERWTADEFMREGTLRRVVAQLGWEAGMAGDMEQVALCDQALHGDVVAVTKCVAVLVKVAMMDEETQAAYDAHHA